MMPWNRAAGRAFFSLMVRQVTGRSRAMWLSFSCGLLAAVVALRSFTDPWPGNLGGFVFVLVVVAGVLRGAILLCQTFRQGWREVPGTTAGET